MALGYLEIQCDAAPTDAQEPDERPDDCEANTAIDISPTGAGRVGRQIAAALKAKGWWSNASGTRHMCPMCRIDWGLDEAYETTNRS